MEIIDGSKICEAFPEFNEHIKICVLNEDRKSDDDPIRKIYYLTVNDLRKILNDFDFEVEKKRTRSWITGWTRKKPGYKVYTKRKRV